MHNIRRLDSFRGLAAIAVLTDHLCATFLMPFLGATGTLNLAMSLLGGWAVIVFFILSGYLITYSILNNVRTNGRFVWKDYFISRIARIYPPLIFSLALCAIIFWIANHFNLHGMQAFRLPTDLYVIRDKFEFRYQEISLSLLMQGGMLDTNGSLWSLYVEVKTYLLAMFVAIFMGEGRIWKIVNAIGAVFVLAGISHFFAYVAIWILGGFFALVLQGHVMKRDHLKPVYGSAVAISFFCFMMEPELFMPNNISTVTGFVASIALSIIVAAFMFDSQIGVKAIALFSGTAKYSYTLYIVHFPLLLFAFSLTHQFLSSNFNVGYLAGVCGMTFVIIIWIAQTMSQYFENKRYFESLIRKATRWFLGMIENFRKRSTVIVNKYLK